MQHEIKCKTYKPVAGAISPPGHSPGLFCALPSLWQPLLPLHLLDPWRSADPLTPVRTAASSPSTETSSHQQALHIRPFRAWITDSLPHSPPLEMSLPLLQKCMNNIFMCRRPNACNFGIDYLKCKWEEVSFQFLALGTTAWQRLISSQSYSAWKALQDKTLQNHANRKFLGLIINANANSKPWMG